MRPFDKLSSLDDKRHNTNTEIPPQELQEDFGYFKTHRGSKQPVRIIFEMGAKRKSCRWQLSGDIDCTGDTIIIEFVSAVVTIKGKGLGKLEDYLHREKVFWVGESRDRHEGIPSYVEKITVDLRK